MLHDDLNTKNETLTSSINYNKELIDKILIKNLTNDNADISVSINGATQTVNENNERVVTSASGYGRVNFAIHDNVNENKNRQFLIISKVHIEDDSVLPMLLEPCVYYFKGNTPIKNMNGINGPTSFNTSGNYLVIGVTPVLTSFTNTLSGNEYDLHDTTSIQFALMSKTNGAKFSFKKYSVIDITGWSDDKISLFKLFIEDKLDDYGYFDYIYFPHAIYSTDATHSNSSDTSELSTYSKYSYFSSFNSFKFNNITNDDIYAFAASINNFEDNIITASSDVNYGEIAIKYNFNVDASYIVIWTGYKFNRVDFINKNNNGWISFSNIKSYTINDITYHSCIITPNSNCKLHAVYFGLINNRTVSFTPISITQVYTNNFELSEDLVSAIISDKEYYIPLELFKISSLSDDTNIKEYSNNWKNKNVLFIGDSLTAANKYQGTIKDILDINIFNHCKGGMGLLQCVDGQTGAGEYDNETYVSGTLYALNTSDVSNKDLIVFYAGYNNRRTNVGVVGDCYDPQNNTGKTIAGYMQYCINRIYEELTEANNLTCKILIVTLDCHGKYPYIDMDGYAEDNGNGTKYISEIQEAVAHANGLACCNLYKNSGINKNTWCVFGASSSPEVSTYTKYKINNDGTVDYNTQLNYTTGNYYNQIRNGEVVSEQYNGSSPYPYNGDQLHKSDAGYKRIGECITGSIIANYGK